MKASKATNMGQAALIRRFFVYCAIGLVAVVPALAQAAATAQGVALNASASCSNANLNLTLTTSAASREYGKVTNLAGVTLHEFEDATALGNFSGTFLGADNLGYKLPFSSSQPADTLIGAYAYVGETPPAGANTAEFFVYYNCTTRQIVLACFGPYGTCPKTALEGAFHAGAREIPVLRDTALALTVLLLGAAGGVAVRRRQRPSLSPNRS